MRFLKNALLFLSLAFSIISCVPKDLEIELPVHQPKLSIFSQVIPDKIILVTVTKSFNSLIPADTLQQDSAFIEQLMVSNAIVTINYAGKTEVLQNIRPGVYMSTNTLQYPNENYTLQVKDPATGIECSATSQMLQRLNFADVKPVTEIKGNDTSVYIDYTIHDEPNKDNYYLLSYTSFKQHNQPPTNPFLIAPKDNSYQLLSDKLFTGSQYKGKLPVTSMPGDTVAVSLSNISEEYYKYLAVYQKAGKVFNQLTGEPINFPTNVQNGYGFFTTHNPDVRIIEL